LLAGSQNADDIQVIRAEEGVMGQSVAATLACATLFTVLVGFRLANAQSSSSKPEVDATASIDEHHFVVQAALSNMAEVQLGHLATEKGQRTEVKKFAQTMIQEHLQSQKELAEAAYGAGIKWPTQLNDSNRQLRQRLSSVSNDQFDQAYMKAVVDAHRDAEGMLDARSAETSEADTLAAKVNTWAAKTLPAVRAHLQQAERISSELGK
jgi:putative membrane protein